MCSSHQEGQVPFSTLLFYYTVYFVPDPIYLTDIFSCEVSITLKCVATTNLTTTAHVEK